MATLPENDRLTGPFTAIAAQVAFDADWPLIDAPGDTAGTCVVIRRERAGVITEHLLATGFFSITASSANAFTATLAAGATAGDKYWLIGRQKQKRLRAHPEGGAIRTPTLEDDARELAARAQEARRDLDRAVLVPPGEAGLETPTVAERAGKLAIFDGAGKLDKTSRTLVAFDASVAAAAADREQTGLDRVQTGLDRVATAADRVQTGADRTAAAASATLAQAQTDYSLLTAEASPAGTDLIGVFRSSLKKLTLTNLAAFVIRTAAAFLPAGSGAAARTPQDKLRDYRDVRDYGVVSDSTGTNGTDWTATLVSLFGGFASDGYRGIIRIPYGVRFTAATVYAAVYPGLFLRDESGINFGQPPGYRSNYVALVGGSSVSDDLVEAIIDPHHPARAFINLGTAASASAAGRFASPVLYSVGIFSENKDPALVWQSLYRLDDDTGQSVIKDVLYTPIAIAMKDPRTHTVGRVYAASARCISDGGKIYKTTAGGTAGATAPTGTGTAINDGGVLWAYEQAALTLETARFKRHENGSFEQSGPGPIKHALHAGSQSVWHELAADGTWTARHEDMGLDAWVASPTTGFTIGIGPSFNRLTISTATFGYPVTGAGKTSASVITTCTIPVGRTRARLNIRFEGVTTVTDYFSGGGANFLLRDGIDVVPPDGAEMEFEYDAGYSGVWREVYRSFEDVRIGTTAQRPYFGGGRGVGFRYFDTTLDPAGKAIRHKGGNVWALNYYSGSATYDPASLADGAGATTTVTVTGAALGDLAFATFSLDLQGITVTAWVSATGTVSVRFQNETGGTIDLASGTLRAKVEKF